MIPTRILDTIINLGTSPCPRIASTDPAIQVDIEVWHAVIACGGVLAGGVGDGTPWRAPGTVTEGLSDIGWDTMLTDLPGNRNMADFTDDLLKQFDKAYGFEPPFLWLVEEAITHKETVGDLVQYVRKNMHFHDGWREAMAIEPRPTPDFPGEVLPPWFDEGSPGCPQPGSCDRPVYNADDYPPLPS